MSGKLERIASSYRRFYTSQHYEDWDPRILERYDASDLIRRVDALGAEVVYVTARTHNGHWFCDVGWGGMHRGLRGTDQVSAFTEHFHAKGKPVLAYLSTIYDKRLYDEHPEWRQLDAEGRPVAEQEGSWGKILCPNSPYREHLMAMIQRLVETHDIDGFFLDMTFFHAKPCYCQSCSRLFRSRYGGDPPQRENWDDPLFRRFVQFREDTNHSFVRDICAAAKKADPDIAISVQYPILRAGATSGQSIALGREPDYVYTDVYFGGGYLHMSVCARIARAISRHRPEIGIMTRPGSHADAPNMKSFDHLRSEAFTVVANGAGVMLFDIMMPDGTVQAPMWDRIARVFDEIREREPWLGGRSIGSVAVFYSEATRIWYGRSDRKQRYDDHLFGACRALLEEHIPYDIVVELTREELQGYQVLLLPNAVCLSAAEAEALREFVRAGGGVVCTGMTSLWNEGGEPCRDYQLHDVLGVSYVGDTGAYSKVYSQFATDEPVAQRLPVDGLITSCGPLAKVALRGATALAHIVYPYAEPSADRFVNIMTNPPAVPSDWPACTVNAFGAGRALYFAGGLDRDYANLSFPELKWVLADAVRMVSRDPLRIELRGPMSVELTAFERDDGRQLVVHLVNFQPETGRELAHSRHQVQEIIPVHDLELIVRTDRQVERVNLAPGGAALEYEQNGGVVRVHIGEVDCHRMIVIDLR